MVAHSKYSIQGGSQGSGEQAQSRGFGVLGGFMSIALGAVLASGASLSVSLGVCYAAAGLLMLVCPPQMRVSPVFYGLGAALMTLAAMPLLPAGWFPLPSWRKALVEAGMDLGCRVTPHPEGTLEHWSGMAVSVVVALYLLSHRVSSRYRLQLALLFCAGAALYTIISMVLYALPVRPAWDPSASFGIFPNRNHTATLLSMGVVSGLGVVLQSIRHKEGGAAMLAALSTVVCLCGVLGFSSSRGGVLLTCGGVGAWMALLGPNYVSKRTGAVLAVLTAATVAVFWSTETVVKPRLTESMSRISTLAEDAFAGSGGETGNLSANQNLAASELRIPIMRETFRMMKEEPWCGSGLGMFRYVFPQYQAASAGAVNSSVVLHPESDWLWLAAEAGPWAAVALAAALLLAGRKALQGGGSERGWPVRLACVIAAFLVPFHGIFDVPGHRLGLAWSSMVLLTMALRRTAEAPAGAGSRLSFRLAGLAAIGAGGWLLTGVWLKTPLPSSLEPLRLYAEARTLYEEDAAERAAVTATDGPVSEYAEGEDKVSAALRLLDKAIAITPMDPALHYLEGALALHFDDKDALADAAFARQRLLEPMNITVPLRQAAGWSAIDPVRTAQLWKEALNRAKRMELYASHLNGPFSVNSTYRAIMEQVRTRPGLEGLSLEVADQSPELFKIWVMTASQEGIKSRMAELLSAEMSPADRKELLEVLAKRGIRNSSLEKPTK